MLKLLASLSELYRHSIYIWGEEFMSDKLPLGLHAVSVKGAPESYTSQNTRASETEHSLIPDLGMEEEEPVSIAVGSEHVVILTNSGKVYTFGYWVFLGNASITSINPIENPGALTERDHASLPLTLPMQAPSLPVPSPTLSVFKSPLANG